MKKEIVIVGAGGHAKVVLDALRQSGEEVVGFVDRRVDAPDASHCGLPIFGEDAFLRRGESTRLLLANGVGSTQSMENRKTVFERFSAAGFEFASVVHPASIVSPRSALGAGVQLMAGTVVQADAHIADNSIVNSGAIVEHDCRIGRHCHLAPGVTLSGGVVVGEQTHVGAGSTVVQGVRIGMNCMVAAGAVVTADVPDGARVAGVPAKRMRQ